MCKSLVCVHALCPIMRKIAKYAQWRVQGGRGVVVPQTSNNFFVLKKKTNFRTNWSTVQIVIMQETFDFQGAFGAGILPDSDAGSASDYAQNYVRS